MAFKFRVAKQGKSINDSDNDQIFDSSFPVFNIVQAGTGVGDQTITNSLGVPTAFFIWTQDGWKPGSWRLHKGGKMSSTNGSIQTNVPAGVNYKYIITQRGLGVQKSLTPIPTGTALAVTDGTIGLDNALWGRINFHSAKGTFQVWKTGQTTLDYVTDNTPYEITIPHGFSFTPAFISYGYGNALWAIFNRSGILDKPGFAVYSAGRITQTYYLESCIDSTNIYFRVTAYAEGAGFLDPADNGPRSDPDTAAYNYVIFAAIDES